MSKCIVNVIVFLQIAVKVEGRPRFRALGLARELVIEALIAKAVELRHTARVIPKPPRLIPARIGIEVAADKRLHAKLAAIELKIVPKLTYVAIS